MGGGIGRVTNHSEYYLADGSVSFLVGKTLFKVHRWFFERESEVFRTIFANGAEDDPQSGTDARPFTLDVQPDEFEKLLWVWYDREYSYQRQPKKNWVTILRLSTRWEFAKIRELAIRELEALELPPAERISIYNEHNIEGERLLSSYVDMCKSPTVPTAAEAQLIEMEALINVLQARDYAQRKAVELGHESPTSASLEDDALREIVSKFLKPGSSLNPRSNGIPTGSGDQAPDLNGERAYGATLRQTITLAEPQVPDRTGQSASGSASHLNSSGGEGKRTPEKGKEKEAEKTARSKAKEEESNKGKMKATQDDGEKDKREKATQGEEKEEKAKAEKAKQDKEKEAKEKEKRANQKPPQKSRFNVWDD